MPSRSWRAVGHKVGRMPYGSRTHSEAISISLEPRKRTQNHRKFNTV